MSSASSPSPTRGLNSTSLAAQTRGKTKQPQYRVIAADSRRARDGRFIEILGQYNPRTEPSTITIDNDKAVKWLMDRVDIERINPKSVTLTDGTELEADLLVYATGYGSMNHWLADLISPEVADRVGKVWGLGSGTTKDPGPWEGELRNMWKPTQQEALWFHGGNLHQSRQDRKSVV